MANASAVLACLGALVVGHDWATVEAAPRALTRAAIEEAIVFGATHDPQPYLLRHAGREDNTVVVGAVYTPFLRVAFLSHAAAARGEHLEAADVNPVLTEPLAYIAFRWYGRDVVDPSRAEEFAALRPRVAMLRTPPPSVERAGVPFSTVRGGVPPVWWKPAKELLETFGATLPYDDVAFVAAYPLESLTPLRTFVMYKAIYTEEIPEVVSLRFGVVRAADAAGWR
ncbi:MAG TPA: hypothetical protein VGQ37_25295 [Vicinamibacterales bacterium]|jgi:hypothetical protein|nr:hypothetical protein [Vicinamibacterales bacterium]